MVISAMVVLLLVTGLLNWKYIASNKSEKNNEADKTAETGDVETANFFSTYKSERTSNREEEMTYLESVITNANTDDATIKEAQQMKMEIVSNMELENTIEGLMKAKGFADAVVTFGTTSINVVVKDADLTSAKVAQILDIITSETQYSPNEVKVIQAQ